MGIGGRLREFDMVRRGEMVERPGTLRADRLSVPDQFGAKVDGSKDFKMDSSMARDEGLMRQMQSEHYQAAPAHACQKNRCMISFLGRIGVPSSPETCLRFKI